MDNQQKLQQLREKYKTAPVSLKPIIERQAKALQNAEEMRTKEKQPGNFKLTQG